MEGGGTSPRETLLHPGTSAGTLRWHPWDAEGVMQVWVRVGSTDGHFLPSAPVYQPGSVTQRWSGVFNFIRQKNSDICCAQFSTPVQIYSAL